MRVVFSDEARSDIKRIYEFYAVRQENIQRADKVINILFDAINDHIADLPFIGTPYLDGIHRFVVGQHAIYYKPYDAYVEILRIIAGKEHHSEDINKIGAVLD